MGQLDMIKGFEPINITPNAALGNPLSNYEQRSSLTYASPERFSMAGLPGPFTPAGISETAMAEFLQDRWNWPSANTQFVTVPERPIDAGTYNALKGNAGKSGVYLQGMVTGTVHQYAGSAPTTGIYTGYSSNEGDFEGCF
jgi:hypothetical protein